MIYCRFSRGVAPAAGRCLCDTDVLTDTDVLITMRTLEVSFVYLEAYIKMFSHGCLFFLRIVLCYLHFASIFHCLCNLGVSCVFWRHCMWGLCCIEDYSFCAKSTFLFWIFFLNITYDSYKIPAFKNAERFPWRQSNTSLKGSNCWVES